MTQQIADAIKYVVIEYYGGICWDEAEMALNELGPSELEALELPIFLDDLLWICRECL